MPDFPRDLNPKKYYFGETPVFFSYGRDKVFDAGSNTVQCVDITRADVSSVSVTQYRSVLDTGNNTNYEIILPRTRVPSDVVLSSRIDSDIPESSLKYNLAFIPNDAMMPTLHDSEIITEIIVRLTTNERELSFFYIHNIINRDVVRISPSSEWFLPMYIRTYTRDEASAFTLHDGSQAGENFRGLFDSVTATLVDVASESIVHEESLPLSVICEALETDTECLFSGENTVAGQFNYNFLWRIIAGHFPEGRFNLTIRIKHKDINGTEQKCDLIIVIPLVVVG